MIKSFDEIHEALRLEAVIKYGRKFLKHTGHTRRVKCDAINKYEQQFYNIDKAKIIELSKFFLKINLFDEDQLIRIKNTQIDNQLNWIFLEVRSKIIQILEVIKPECLGLSIDEDEKRNLEKMNQQYFIKVQELEKKIKKLTTKSNKIITNEIKKNKELSNVNYKLDEDVKLFSNNAKKIKGYENLYIKLLLLSNKIPILLALEKFSKESPYPLSKSSWSKLLKSKEFMISLSANLMKIINKIYSDKKDEEEYNSKLEKEFENEIKKQDSLVKSKLIKSNKKIEKYETQLKILSELTKKFQNEIEKIVNQEKKAFVLKELSKEKLTKRDNHNEDFEESLNINPELMG
ncbi:MAG: hypothetical protein J0M18_08355 [Ignavibacteria bacterium]|nr:hypothetical protein [Ignavibacteria bacterium]